MFSKDVVDTEQFYQLPFNSQLLYFHLGINADVKGFVQPQKVVRLTGLKLIDLKPLIEKGFVIAFESGVVVITHWKLNNTLREEREAKSIFLQEQCLLNNTNGLYQLQENSGSTPAQVRLGKVRLGEDSIITPVEEKTGAYDLFIKKMNEITNRKFTNRDKKAKRQFEARLKEGYTMEDLENAIRGCLADDYHKETNYKYLAPEFITRSDKLERYRSAYLPTVNAPQNLSLKEKLNQFNS